MNNTKELLSEYNTLIKENDELYRNVAKALGFSDCAFWILYTLRECGTPVTQREIISEIYLPKQTINSALKKLESGGYIELLTGTDKRSKLVCLTEKGCILAEKTVDCVIAAELKAFDELAEEEGRTFINLFQKFNGLLKKDMKHLKGIENENKNSVI